MPGRRVLNILTGDWVIVSPEGRLGRPWKGDLENDDMKEMEKKKADDPLAPGALRNNGQRMPIYEYTHIFPNDFPTFEPVNDDGTVKGKDERSDDDLFVSADCRGANHVMTYSPDFNRHFALMNKHELVKVLDGWLDFFNQNKANYEYIQIFENRGPEVGSSLPHPHCQIWSTKFLPTTVQKMMANQESYFQKHGTVMLIDYLQKELKLQKRIVFESTHFVVLVPYWAYWPYETMILPRRSIQRISEFTEDEKADFMAVLQTIVGKYDTFFSCSTPYVLGLRNAPVGSFLTQPITSWQFHVQICPPLLVKGRKKFMAGYELLAEVQRDFNGEIAAERLRQTNYTPPN